MCIFSAPAFIVLITRNVIFTLSVWSEINISNKSKKLFSFRGASPPAPDQGLCPWTPLGALPPDIRYRLALPRSPCSSPPNHSTKLRPWGFSTNRWNITLLWLFSCLVLSCPFFLAPTPSSYRATDFRGLWLKWRGSAQGWSFLGLGRWVTSFGGNVPQKLPKNGRE